MLPRVPSPSRLLLAILVTATAVSAVSLRDFQEISGFPQSCTSAYDSQISGCSSSDFNNGAPCSQRCIAGLQDAGSRLNSACQGVSADPTTLIGLFFQGRGVLALCPNAASGGSGGGSYPTPTQQSSTSTTASTASTTSTSTTPSSTSTSASPTATQSTSTTISRSSFQSTVTSSPASTAAAASTTQTPSPAAATTPAPTDQRGGGDPFDMGSTGEASRRTVGSAVIVGLLGVGLAIGLM